ncbi:MAG: hypothetical protein ACR2PF_09635 [Rhizobiaceae bacterium]
MSVSVSNSVLRNPPCNRLEALNGDRKGHYSSRIRDLFPNLIPMGRVRARLMSKSWAITRGRK